MANSDYIRWFDTLTNEDVPEVGGKNASLGEMVSTLKSEGITVPDGFATTAQAYWDFLEKAGLKDDIAARLDELAGGSASLAETGRTIRKMITRADFPEDLAAQIGEAYTKLSQKYDKDEADVAARSSATAEDLPDASFAGQQETFLNIVGQEELLDAVQRCFASLFTDRAISYRQEKGFDHMKVALSVGVQKMVRSDLAGSGVMFSLDTETGFPGAVLINAGWGLGENVVQGSITPDEYRVFKGLLDKKDKTPIVDKVLGDKEVKMVYAEGGTKTTKNVQTTRKERDSFVLEDQEILELSRWAVIIENHYDRPMDMEWAKDGETGDMFIVQARPETVQSQRDFAKLHTYTLKEQGERILEGTSVGDAIAAGKALVIKSASEIERFEEGAVLVTGMTDPDWVPIMKKAAAIVTDQGGRTCHAAIVSRELGLPAVVGAHTATHDIADGREITVSCAEGDKGYIYDGILDFEVTDVDLTDIPETKTRVMLNIASPDASFRWWALPAKGIGLARMEFIVNNVIKIHPMALIRYPELEDKEALRQIETLTRGYEDKTEYFVGTLARGIAKIAAPQHPEPVILRMSDFKTNEYADLIGGEAFEPEEANPMIGFRGASRYYSPKYRDGFRLECRAVRRVREEMGFDNLKIMIPFCRTLDEADRVLEVLAEEGLERGKDGLEVYVMAEIPSNIILAKEFAEKFDGFSIGSNDLTQLVLGVDRDSGELAEIFDERNEAVKHFVAGLIADVHEVGSHVGICGQAPSDYPEFAEFLVEQGIDSISLNPDSVVTTIRAIAEMEAKLGK
jgi:pyruvate,water dikinase